MSGIEQSQEATWLSILRDQCEQTTISEVARKLDYSRPTISLVLSGKYIGNTDLIAAKVIAKFTDYVHCPHQGCDLRQDQCEDNQSRAMPTSDPQALRQWIACRGGCPNSFHTLDDEADHA